jgi:hypothetical protein
MKLPIKTIALYTTIYPGVEPFLADWYRSVQKQTDQDYQLWIGLDTLEVEAVITAIGADPKAIWIIGDPGDTPAQVRQRALAKIVEAYDGVILVDSDDLLYPFRVAAARASLERSDLTGCALRLVDQQGRDLALTLGLPLEITPEDVLPRNNIFGLSNTAFRSDLLRRCLPIPANVVLVDWFLATKAWLYGARIDFDSVIRMDYRQHGANMVRVRSPFSRDEIIRDTERVRQHFQIIRAIPMSEAMSGRLAEVEQVTADVEEFYNKIVLQPIQLERYVHRLNALNLIPLWWSCVANPSLQQMWKYKEIL